MLVRIILAKALLLFAIYLNTVGDANITDLKEQEAIDKL
jgi:hypothetical protein